MKNFEWERRLAEAKQWMIPYKNQWKANIELFNGLRKKRGNKKLDYYFNIYWQSYQTDIALVLPTRYNFYCEVEWEHGSDPLIDSLMSSMLTSQLDYYDNFKAIRKAYLQSILKGYGIVQISIYRTTASKTYLNLGDEIVEYIEPFNRIKLRSIRPEEVLYDKDNNEDLNDLNWLAVNVNVPLHEFIKEDKYKNKKEIIEAYGYDYSDVLDVVNERNIEKRKDINIYQPIKIWEIWDTYSREIYYIEDITYQEAMEKRKYPILNDEFKYPFVFMSLTEDSCDSLPPIAEFDLIAEAQDNINSIRSAEMRDLKRLVRHIFAPADLISPQEEAKLQSTDKQQIIKVDTRPYFTTGNIDLRALLMPAPENPPLPHYYQAVNNIKQDLREVIGYGSMERGGLPPTQTATETNVVMSLLNARGRLKLTDVIAFVENMASKVFMIIRELYPPEFKIKEKLEGDKGIYRIIKREILEKAKLVDIKLRIGVEGVQDKKAQLTTYLNMANVLFPLFQQMNLNIEPIMKKILLLADWKPDEIERLFMNKAQLVEQIAVMMKELIAEGKREIDMMDMMKFMGLVSQLIEQELTPIQKAKLQGKFSSTGGEPPNRQTGTSIPSVRETRLEEDMGKV